MTRDILLHDKSMKCDTLVLSYVWPWHDELTKNLDLVGYADTNYLFDPHKAHSQTGYVFTFNGTTIS